MTAPPPALTSSRPRGTLPRSTARLALILGAFVAIGPLTIDMYLPALPTIRRGLGTTAPRCS